MEKPADLIKDAFEQKTGMKFIQQIHGEYLR